MPAWCLALGTSPPAIDWQAADAAASPQQRFRVAGDIWLANRGALRQALQHPALNDTEIIAALWEQHGEQCLPMLQGMFAFVIWDEAAKSVLLVRDRVGARTLYYSTEGATRWIAPRLRTLQQ